MKKLIIIPAYNEALNLPNLIKNISESIPDFDYIIINDGSRDNTTEVCKKNNLNFIDLPANLGIGGAVQTGYKYAYLNNYDVAVQIDGDGQHDCNELDKLLTKMIDENLDMTIGSRFINKEGFQSTVLRRIGITYFSKLIKLLTKVTITDPTSGFRLVNKDVIEHFANYYPSDYPEPESIVELLKCGYKISECPVTMNERQSGNSSINAMKSIYYMIKVSLAMIVSASHSNKNR